MRKFLIVGMLGGFSSIYAQDTLPYRPDPELIREIVAPPSRYGKILFDLFEYNPAEGELGYDVEAWFGGDFNRLWVETEGEHSFRDGSGTLERFDLYYSRLIAPFWDVRAGMGTHRIYGDASSDRVYFAAGVQGLAPYWFETDLNLRVDTEGNVTADGEVELDLLFTQRLILQPRAEFLFSFSDAEKVGIYSGLNSVELGLRLRYEIRREFAPYAGVSWTRFFGRSAEAVREGGEKAGTFSIVIGIRMWL